ncbi:MAG: phospholipid carrier-dependent glycosyltransferase, partial [Deltaproteobacteria bacterium]|nr:phospholipid carrier-dependent glycosyltransferase [Deltaproteobacteria bacterium]
QMAMASATILFLVPGVLIAAILTTVDSGVMFYSFLSFSALLSWFKLRQKHWFVLSGIFCGLAVGTKYTAIVVTFLTMEILLIVHEYFVEKRSFFRGAQQVFLFAVFVLCCASPWFIKNLWYTGNPIYPYFNWIFGSHASQLIEYKHYMLHMNSFFGEFASSDKPWFDFILPSLKAPWTITMTVNGMTAGKTGVLFLLCLPGVFFLKKDRIFCYLLLIAGCSFWGWV